MKKTTKFNHFIQKAFVENFARNKEINWTIYGTNEFGKFNINDKHDKHKTAKKYFYSQEIEDGMNLIESDGISVLRKIAFKANNKEEISLSRRELMSIKFYSLLTGTRMPKLRKNINNQEGDRLFNEMISNDKRTAKEIQEASLKIIIKGYKINRNGPIASYYKKIEKLTNIKFHDQIDLKLKNTPENFAYTRILNEINSRIMIFKFEKPILFLSESMNFTESNSYGGIKYSFFPIAPNVGIMHYFDPVSARGLMNLEDSIYFNSDISIKHHKVSYKKIDLMKKELAKYIDKNLRTNLSSDFFKLQNLFLLTEAGKYKTQNDRYIYQVLLEKESVANFCNAMSLVHNNKCILIYQDKNDIYNAEELIKKLNIVRIEDLNK